MSRHMPRRSFMAFAAGALLMPHSLLGRQRGQSEVPPLVDEVPPMLDHILLGSNDLERGMAFVEEHSGVRAAFGGVHPGRGTQNALLSLGARRYLEIIAPDPNQQQGRLEAFALKQYALLKEMASPRLVGWAAHPGDLEKFSARLREAGVAFLGPWPGSRTRQDGSAPHWKTVNLKDDANALLPFFIEWSADSPHPSTDAPSGCQLLRFELLTPDPAALDKRIAKLALKAPLAQGPAPELHAVISGPKGKLDITS